MIELNDSYFLGKGTSRTCYFDPRDATRCIKIDSGARSFSQTKQEGKYYDWIARKRPHFSFDCFPRFYGFVETNLGLGGVYDAVRDSTSGTTSKTLRHYMQDGSVTRELDRWEEALRRLRESVLRNSLVVGDLGPGNICASQGPNGVIQLVIIDGIGHRDFLPLCDYIPALARRRSRRQMLRYGLTSVEDLLSFAEKRQKARLQKKPIALRDFRALFRRA